jgi:hypothetical protein
VVAKTKTSSCNWGCMDARSFGRPVSPCMRDPFFVIIGLVIS